MGKINNMDIIHSRKTEFNNIYPVCFPGCKTKTVTFIVTQNCNLRCSYCYEKNKNCEHDMTFETAKKIIDLMFAEDSIKSKLINEEEATALIMDFIGGEPLLKITLVDKIMTYFVNEARRRNHRWAVHYMISISTNGILYFEPECQKFFEKWKGRLSLGITIDGNKKLHDSCRLFPDGKPSFDIVQMAFKDALNKGYTHSTKMTLAPANIQYLSGAIIDLLNYEGVEDVPANCVFEENWTIDQAKVIYSELIKLGKWIIDNERYTYQSCSLFTSTIGRPKDYTNEDDNKNFCGGTGKMLAFDNDGNIYPCLRYTKMSLSNLERDPNQFILGNLTDGLIHKKEHCDHINCLKCITATSQSPKKCLECHIADGCAWCSAWNFDYYGDPNKRYTGICNTHKARVLANAWYWNTLYRKLGMKERFKLTIPKEWALEIIDEEEYNKLLKLAED